MVKSVQYLLKKHHAVWTKLFFYVYNLIWVWDGFCWKCWIVIFLLGGQDFNHPGHTLTDSICQVGFPPLNAWFSPGKSCCPAEAGHQPAERCPLFSGNGWQPRSSGASVNASQHLSQRPLTSSNVFSFSSFSSDVCGGQHRSTLLKNLILADACHLGPGVYLWTSFSS